MPQIDLKYSCDLNLDILKIFQEIELLINKLDSSSGECKCRAYPADDYLHSHIYTYVKVLNKPHRDEEFMKNLLRELSQLLKPFFPQGCFYSIELDFSGDYYLTSRIAT